MLDAQPVAGKKKGADRGIDGLIPYFAGLEEGYVRAPVSVKGGDQVGPSMVRDLIGVVDREKSNIGIFVTLKSPTAEMKREAAAAGFYHNDLMNKSYARIQILTVGEMFAGRRPELPLRNKPPYAKAEFEKEPAIQPSLGA